MRWQHPERGLVSPGDFIELAEENGAILPIGRWVLREACRRAAGWGPERRAVFLCVNVSAREIQQPGFVAGRRGSARPTPASRPVVSSSRSPRPRCCKATPSTIETLEALRGLGVRVVIDDFGTGYFSLSHLRQFPVDILKIASEFVEIADGDSKSAALAGAIVAMGRSLGIQTVAEGIETAEQAARMRVPGLHLRPGLLLRAPGGRHRARPDRYPGGSRAAIGGPPKAAAAVVPLTDGRRPARKRRPTVISTSAA